MTRILSGSQCIKHWFPDFPRSPKDTDYIVQESIKGSPEVEYLLNTVFKDYKYNVLSPNDIYTLKISHCIGWDINWSKHMWDIQFLKKKGCTINKELFYTLYDYWNTVHEKNKRSDLEMTSKDFFNNAIKSEYEHDFLHTILNPIPTYTKVLKDGAEVEVSEEKFNTLSFEDKCNLVLEEVMLMAAERRPKMHFQHSYSWMLKKFILNHAPIFEAIFIIEHYPLLERPPYNFIEKINNHLRLIGKNELI